MVHRSPHRSLALRLSLCALLLPFLVGFGYPDSTGTYAGVSAGRGRYRFTPACTHDAYSVDFQEAEISLQHRIAMKPPEPDGGFLKAMKPGHVSFGMNADFMRKQITLVGVDTSSVLDPSTDPGATSESGTQVGSRRDALGYALGARIGLDWKWVGATAGVAALAYSNEEYRGNLGSGSQPAFLPILGLRLGDENLVYLSSDLMGSSPIASGGSMLELGLGGKWLGTRLWGGYGALPFERTVAIFKASRPVGPLDLSLGMAARVEDFTRFEEYGASLGLGYRIPWE
jgi:hypothetical protein